MFTQEQVAKLPDRGDAVAFHLRPAYERAERNRQAWLKGRENEPDPSPDAGEDRATQEFVTDGGEVDLTESGRRPRYP